MMHHNNKSEVMMQQNNISEVMMQQNKQESTGGFLNLLSFLEICRTCLQKITTTNIGFPIQGSKFQEIAFKEILELHAQIQITEDDYLPQNICANCVFTLCTMHAFCIKCKDSDQILRTSPVHSKGKKASQVNEISTKNVTYGSQQDTLQNCEPKHEESPAHIKDIDNCGSSMVSPENEVIVAQEHHLNLEFSKNRVRKKFDLKKKTRINQQTHKCTDCNKLLKSRSSLWHHRLCHTDTRSFICEFCGKSFKRTQQLKMHINSHHSHTRFTCTDCGRTFANIRYLRQHQKCHGAKNFLCSDCGKAFVRSDDLVKHYRTHTKEASYHCIVCSKSFARSDTWHKHNRIHTGERPYKCSMCSMCFKQGSTLKTHMMLHTGNKPHKCTVCTKTFTSRYHMRAHARRHAGEALLNSVGLYET